MFRQVRPPEFDLSDAWDEQDRSCISSREHFRWFMGSYLPHLGYEVILEEREAEQ
jgi:hypothetical protein